MHPMFIAALFTIAKIWKQSPCGFNLHFFYCEPGRASFHVFKSLLHLKKAYLLGVSLNALPWPPTAITEACQVYVKNYLKTFPSPHHASHYLIQPVMISFLISSPYSDSV